MQSYSFSTQVETWRLRPTAVQFTATAFYPFVLNAQSMTFTTYALIALGGALGTLARYGVSTAAVPLGKHLPWATILINIAGSFVIGFFGTLTLSHGRYPVSETTRLFVMVGFCGGFTTFSSFSLQTLELLQKGALGRATLNVLLSVTLCLCAVAAGHLLAARMNGGMVQAAQISGEEA